MDMQKFSDENQEIERRGRQPRTGGVRKNYKKFRYILVIIDCFSKYLWLVPMKSKTKVETARCLEGVIRKSKRKPTFLWTDKGAEYRNLEVRRVLKKYNIKLYHTENVEKSCIAERSIYSYTGLRLAKLLLNFLIPSSIQCCMAYGQQSIGLLHSGYAPGTL